MTDDRRQKLKIVIFNVNWLGDVLFSTPAIRLIRKNYPDSFISCIISPRCKEVLEGNPNLDEVILYDEKSTHKGIFAKLKFIFFLRGKRFDCGFLFHRSFTRALILFLAGIRERAGYTNKKRGFLLTKKIAALGKDSLHRAGYYLNIVQSYLGEAQNIDFRLDFPIFQEDKAAAERLLSEAGIKRDDFLVVLNPAGNWPQKRWPKENFAKLSEKLADDYQAKVIIIGAEKDISLAEEIKLLSAAKVYNFCAKLNLKQVGALAQMAKVFISGDSGPLHIAYASGGTVIALYGPTSTSVTGPYHAEGAVVIQKDVGCDIPCYEEGCKELCCMKAITVGDVMDKIQKIAYTSHVARDT